VVIAGARNALFVRTIAASPYPYFGFVVVRYGAMVIALVVAGLALMIWPVRTDGTIVAARVSDILPPADKAERQQADARDSRARNFPRLVVILAGLAIAILFPSLVGVVAGGAVAFALDKTLRRLEPAAVRRTRLARQRALPGVLDLLAVALRAGMPLDRAIDVVADAARGPLSVDLRAVAASTRLGSAAALAWAPHADDPVWGPVARAVRRSATSGSALAMTFERLAQDRRDESVHRAESAVRRAAVLAMAPLGLCFLPAFICVGVVPVVVGLLTNALH
jgi:pilus assembly protein TadC